ncbi:MAG: hypothetical protein LKE37_09845 [Atopobiaceae bacterium]|nr:hypothetical protein [Atopobiaceae bacterium]
MPFVKPISGHTKLGAAQRYLEKEGRALARDFLNLDAPMAGIGEDGLPEYREYDWASVMDETREKLALRWFLWERFRHRPSSAGENNDLELKRPREGPFPRHPPMIC